MEAQEKLLGFDICEMWLSLSDWPQARQDHHLIRHDIEKPLSVDAAVWQSVFDLNSSPAIPSFHGPIQFLWDDLTRMRQYFAHISDISQPSRTIAVTVFFNLLTVEEKKRWGIFDEDLIKPANYSAKFIGYDVADRFLQSGLMNTGFDESERAIIKSKWGDHLNKYHLFTDYALADEFRQFINPLTPGHAPFYVNGLYTLDE